MDKLECKKADSNRGIDHWYDYLGYGCLAIPLPHQIEEEEKRENRWARVVPEMPDENAPYIHNKTKTRGY